MTIGNHATNTLLIPYLSGLIEQEEDEVLFSIAEELGAIWKLCNEKTIFLPLLEKLAASDETVVRE